MPQKKTFTLKLAYKRLSCLTRKTEFWQTNKHRKSSKILDHLISEEAGGKTIQCHLFGTKCARFSLTDLSLILFVDLPLDVLMLTRWISIQLSKVSNCGRIEATFTLKRQSEICILVKCVARRIRYFFAGEAMVPLFWSCNLLVTVIPARLLENIIVFLLSSFPLYFIWAILSF